MTLLSSEGLSVLVVFTSKRAANNHVSELLADYVGKFMEENEWTIIGEEKEVAPVVEETTPATDEAAKDLFQTLEM